MGLTKVLQNKLQNKVHEAKEKVNPYSTTNKNARVEAKKEQMEERKAEREAYHKERAHQIEERGKQKAKHEFGNNSSGNTRHKSVKGAVKYAGRTPRITLAGDPMTAFLGPSFFEPTKKPKPQTKTTKIVTGGRTITIKENQEQQEQQQKKKKDVDLSYLDPFKFDF